MSESRTIFLIGAADVDAHRVDRFAVSARDVRRVHAPPLPRTDSRSSRRRCQPLRPFAVVPEQPRPNHAARISREVVPAVIVDVVLRLVMTAGQQRCAKLLRQASREKADAIGRAHRGLIEQDLADRIVPRPPRHQVDHAAHRAGAVERRRDALDDFDLSEIHRRNLQQAEAADLLPASGSPSNSTRV